MAEGLGTVVFKVPELGALERQLREKQEAKDEQQRMRREREINATGAEAMYSKNAYKLKAGYDGIAQGAFSQMMKAGIEYEKNGSSEAKSEFDKWNQKLNQIMNVGATVSSGMLNEYQDFYAKQGEGYAATQEQVDQEFSSKINRSVNWKIENGDILVESGSGYVPYAQHTMFSDKLNSDNSFLIPREAKTGRYVVPTSFIMDRENVGVLSRSADADEAYRRLNKQIGFKLESDQSFLEDVAVYAEIARGHISGKEPISIQMVNDAVKKMNNEDDYREAVDLYSSAVRDRVFDVYNQFKEQKVDPTSEEALYTGEGQAVDGAQKKEDTQRKEDLVPERRIDMTGALNQAPVTMNADFAVNENEVQSYIDKYSDGKSPITAQDVIDVSAKYGVPVELILAQGRLESNFGTKGRGARTKNIYNVGNYTAGDTMPKDSAEQKAVSREMEDWTSGLEAYAKLLKEDYMPEDGNWNTLLDEEFVNKDGNRYATDDKYETTLKSLISDIYKLNNEKSVSSQGGSGSGMSDKEYESWLKSKGL